MTGRIDGADDNQLMKRLIFFCSYIYEYIICNVALLNASSPSYSIGHETIGAICLDYNDITRNHLLMDYH